MYNRFIKYIETHRLLEKDNRVLLAISGGLDSVVLATLLSQSPYQFGMVHCNFKLRGEDSDIDEAFVKSLAEEMQVKFVSKNFDTYSYAQEHKMSVQMAARAIRYAFFEKVRAREGYDAIATAHHLDDSIETLIINISRGTGLSGLKGIPKKNNKIIRPLLFASRDDVESFAKLNQLSFREDRSNKEEKYLRNKIRHRLLPIWRNINPDINRSIQYLFDRMEATEAIFSDTINKFKQVCFRFTENETQIVIRQLLRLPQPRTVLYEFIKEYGFNSAQANDIFNSISGQAGKVFSSITHKLIKDRDYIIIIPVRHANFQKKEFIIDRDADSLTTGSLKLIFNHGTIQYDSIQLPKNSKTLMADADKLCFPLILRHWRIGDTMAPLGMTGRKKISDILIDEKTPLHKKDEIMVLCSGDEIVWLVGVRVAESIKITKKTKKYFLARLL